MATRRKKNLDVGLDKSTIRRAQRLADARASSVSRLVTDGIARTVGEDAAYAAAERRAIARMEQGYPLGGHLQADREALHER